MDKSRVLFEFDAQHKGIGSIYTNVRMYEDRIVLTRQLTGIIATNVSLPAETTVFYKDIQAINFTPAQKGFFATGIGWIALAVIAGNVNGITKTVNVTNYGLVGNNSVDAISAMQSPYNIVYSTNKESVPGYYSKMKQIYEEYLLKSKQQDAGQSNSTVANNAQSPIEQIKRLKELLDIGAISQEEYDKKKEKLLAEI